MLKMHRFAVALSLLVGVAACSEVAIRDAGQHAIAEQSKDCQIDLDFAAAFLMANDAGIHGMAWKAYPAPVAKVLEHERGSAATTQSVRDCVALIDRFLRSIRKGHLYATPSVPTDQLADNPRDPPRVNVRRLSGQTLFIGVPSFGPGIGEQLIQAIEDEKNAFRKARNLIIDVRRNGGGRDNEFRPLLEVLGPATYRSPYPDLFVTSANLAAWEAFAKQNPPGVEQINGLIARMKSADKEWAPMSDQAFVESRHDLHQVKASPKQVVVLIGADCASSCEQFVVTARQNERVTLMGQRTFGALDASNLLTARTPSGQITLWYASTFIRRPNGQIIDDIGIQPDIVLPLPADEAAFANEVAIAQKAVENGLKLHAREAQQAVPADGLAPLGRR